MVVVVSASVQKDRHGFSRRCYYCCQVYHSRLLFLSLLHPSSSPPSLRSRQAESASEKSAGGAIAAFAFFLSIIFGIFSVFLFMWRQYLPVRAGGRVGGANVQTSPLL